MRKHKQTGLLGEQLAANYLLNKGYAILERNWRMGQKEVDLIVEKATFIVFVEVKTRTNFNYGFPEESVTDHKQSLLKAAAEAYIEAHPSTHHIRFDIISILLQVEAPTEIKHFEDAFY